MVGIPLLNFEVELDSAVAVGRRGRKRTRQRPLWNSCLMMSVNMVDSFARLHGQMAWIGHEGGSIEAVVVGKERLGHCLLSGRRLLWELRLCYRYELLSSEDAASLYHKF